MMDYKIHSKTDEAAVRLAYLMLLNREPENKKVIDEAILSQKTIGALREALMASSEFKSKPIENVVGLYLSNFLQHQRECGLDKKNRASTIKILQTSDAKRYKKLLQASAVYNKLYAVAEDIEYQSFVGIKRGFHPHHAMFNRIFLLRELVLNNYTGWVFYLDADAFVSAPSFSLREKLSDLREKNKSFWLHTVRAEEDPNYNWWDINTGCFAIDLGSSAGRSVVVAWSNIYRMFYSDNDFVDAASWGDLIDDQYSLSMIIRYFKMENSIQLERFQTNWVTQVLRSNANGISSDEELAQRQQLISQLGDNVYKIMK